MAGSAFEQVVDILRAGTQHGQVVAPNGRSVDVQVLDVPPRSEGFPQDLPEPVVIKNSAVDGDFPLNFQGDDGQTYLLFHGQEAGTYIAMSASDAALRFQNVAADMRNDIQYVPEADRIGDQTFVNSHGKALDELNDYAHAISWTDESGKPKPSLGTVSLGELKAHGISVQSYSVPKPVVERQYSPELEKPVEKPKIRDISTLEGNFSREFQENEVPQTLNGAQISKFHAIMGNIGPKLEELHRLSEQAQNSDLTDKEFERVDRRINTILGDVEMPIKYAKDVGVKGAYVEYLKQVSETGDVPDRAEFLKSFQPEPKVVEPVKQERDVPSVDANKAKGHEGHLRSCVENFNKLAAADPKYLFTEQSWKESGASLPYDDYKAYAEAHSFMLAYGHVNAALDTIKTNFAGVISGDLKDPRTIKIDPSKLPADAQPILKDELAGLQKAVDEYAESYDQIQENLHKLDSM